MASQTAAGATIAFSSALPATNDQVGYEALTFSEAAEVTAIGSFGRTYNVVPHLPLSARAQQKRKGSYNNGTITPTAAYDAADAGQVLLEAALLSDAEIAVSVTFQDGAKEYFQGLVVALTKEVGEVDSIVMISPTIEITAPDFVRVAAP